MRGGRQDDGDRGRYGERQDPQEMAHVLPTKALPRPDAGAVGRYVYTRRPVGDP
jgi:hypothetical protein